MTWGDGEGAQAYLGRERWDRMYRFNEIAQSGATLTFASDVVTTYELHRADPMLGMQIATTRVDPRRRPGWPGRRSWPATRSTPRSSYARTTGWARSSAVRSPTWWS